MARHSIDEMRVLARGVRVPDQVREGVGVEAERLRREGSASSAPRFGGAARVLTWRRAVPRAAAAVACAVALFAVAALAGAPGMPLIGTPRGSGGSDAPAVATDEGNSFVLKAYADGVPQGADTVLALGKYFNTAGSVSGTDDDDISISHLLDLTVTGNNIESVTYSVASEDVPGRFVFEANVRDRSQVPPGGVTGWRKDELTIPYDGQNPTGGEYQYNLRYTGPRTDELRAASDALGGGGASEEDWNHWVALAEQLFAQRLSEARFVMTATFEDGSTQTRSYEVKPVEDFLERYLELRKRMGEEGYEALEDASSLYTITEVEK